MQFGACDWSSEAKPLCGDKGCCEDGEWGTQVEVVFGLALSVEGMMERMGACDWCGHRWSMNSAQQPMVPEVPRFPMVVGIHVCLPKVLPAQVF